MENEIKFITDSPLKALAVSDGFQFGLGVFETMRGLSDGIEDFEAHMERLIHSAVELRIPIPNEFKDLNRLKTSIEADMLTDSIKVVKLTLFKQGSESRWMVTERPFPYKKEDLEKGFNLTISTVQRSTTSIFQRHKTLNYGENWFEKQKAIENGYQEVLFLNENHHLTETSASNLFFYKEGKWHTPNLNCGLLNGIMRQRFINHFAKMGNEVIAGQYFLDDLLTAEHVILTNALMGLMPVKSIAAHRFKMVTKQEIINFNVIDPTRFLIE